MLKKEIPSFLKNEISNFVKRIPAGVYPALDAGRE